MAILRHVDPKSKHKCELPEHPEEKHGEGTVWECNGCGKQFRLDYNHLDEWIWAVMSEANYLPSQRY